MATAAAYAAARHPTHPDLWWVRAGVGAELGDALAEGRVPSLPTDRFEAATVQRGGHPIVLVRCRTMPDSRMRRTAHLLLRAALGDAVVPALTFERLVTHLTAELTDRSGSDVSS